MEGLEPIQPFKGFFNKLGQFQLEKLLRSHILLKLLIFSYFHLQKYFQIHDTPLSPKY